MGYAAVRSEAATPSVAAGVSSAELEAVLQRVEQHLDDLQSALSARDMPCIELHAGELQKALALAVERFMQAARRGGPPLPLRRRLGLASAQVAAQRDALARATAALDRAIDVLMPGHGSALYSPSGAPHPRGSRASIEA
ncbi:MAG TPA: hypothetical protein VLJ62_25210 [Burkholderiaceae bacterium]|nr:hypothetical protein [Burkholderiaceae bacterium]